MHVYLHSGMIKVNRTQAEHSETNLKIALSLAYYKVIWVHVFHAICLMDPYIIRSENIPRTHFTEQMPYGYDFIGWRYF